jgi:hypothetical protein
MVATLKDVTGQQLSAKLVCFLIADGSGHTNTAIGVTDASGRAVMDAIPVEAGQYMVTAQFGGSVQMAGSPVPVTLDFDDPCYSLCTSGTVPNDKGVCGARVTYAAPVGTDNCPGATTVQTAGQVSGTTFPVGTTTVTCMARDAAGNTATCNFTVTVVDPPPVVTITGPAAGALYSVNTRVKFTATFMDANGGHRQVPH